MGKVGWAVLAGGLMLINLPLLHRLLRAAPEATLRLPYEDDFSSPATVGAHYFSTGGQWRTQAGELFSPGVKNNPLWLKARLPPNVVIDFDARSASPEGDIRVEVFGNGVDHLSGYELVQGGWSNSTSPHAKGFAAADWWRPACSRRTLRSGSKCILRFGPRRSTTGG
jgi:hypothetical protein